MGLTKVLTPEKSREIRAVSEAVVHRLYCINMLWVKLLAWLTRVLATDWGKVFNQWNTEQC